MLGGTTGVGKNIACHGIRVFRVRRRVTVRGFPTLCDSRLPDIFQSLDPFLTFGIYPAHFLQRPDAKVDVLLGSRFSREKEASVEATVPHQCRVVLEKGRAQVALYDLDNTPYNPVTSHLCVFIQTGEPILSISR